MDTPSRVYVLCILCIRAYSNYVKIMVKVVKSQPADHSTKGTESAVLTTDHVVPSGQFKNSSTKKYMRAYESRT